MEGMIEKTETMEDRLTGHSLVDSLARTNKEATLLSKTFKQIETPTFEEPELEHTIGKIRSEIALKPPRALPEIPVGSSNVQIAINGPFYIREEADIYKLAKAIGEIQMKKVVSRRSRV